MRKFKICVTGGTGFIGSTLVKQLIKEGHDVRVFDNNFRGSSERLKDCLDSIEIIEGDIRSEEDVSKAMSGCDTVFHLAYINGTRYFYEKPDLVLDVGVRGALNTLEVARKQDVERYILASSSEVYQQPTHIPTTEKERAMIPDVQNPRYSYGGGKLISELLTLNYLRDTDVQHCIFRPHNVFGPQMGFEHVLPELISKIVIATEHLTAKSCKLSIQGSGEETRAFCYVEDAVDQLLSILNHFTTGEVYHIGMDEEITILQLIQDIGKIMGVSIEVTPGELRKGGTSRRCPSIEKVKQLGYSKQNHYIEGLQKTCDWYTNYYTGREQNNGIYSHS